MKNIIKIGLSLIVLINTGCASSKIKAKNTQEYKSVVVLENGVKRKVRVVDADSKLKTTNTTLQNKDSKDGVIVSFKDDSKVSLEAFERKYGLKFKKKLIIGYYIFENNSKMSDIDIVSAIINDESNIKTVKPNWKMKNVAY
jgi:hypothetical protein